MRASGLVAKGRLRVRQSKRIREPEQLAVERRSLRREQGLSNGIELRGNTNSYLTIDGFLLSSLHDG